MKLSIGFQIDVQTETDYNKEYVLKLNKNIYGINQRSFNWYEKLKNSIVDRDFKPSAIDPCLYIGNGMIVLTYVDDCIIVRPSMVDIDALFRSMKNVPEKFLVDRRRGYKQIPWH